jgi:hypothetical protein
MSTSGRAWGRDPSAVGASCCVWPSPDRERAAPCRCRRRRGSVSARPRPRSSTRCCRLGGHRGHQRTRARWRPRRVVRSGHASAPTAQGIGAGAAGRDSAGGARPAPPSVRTASHQMPERSGSTRPRSKSRRARRHRGVRGRCRSLQPLRASRQSSSGHFSPCCSRTALTRRSPSGTSVCKSACAQRSAAQRSAARRCTTACRQRSLRRACLSSIAASRAAVDAGNKLLFMTAATFHQIPVTRGLPKPKRVPRQRSAKKPRIVLELGWASLAKPRRHSSDQSAAYPVPLSATAAHRPRA